MLTIYGSPFSTRVRKVIYVANYLNVEYELVPVNPAKGETRTPEYLAKHPAGKIPCFEDNGFVLFESNAMSMYLAKKHDSSLLPTALEQQAVVHQWMDYVVQHLDVHLGSLYFNKHFAEKFGREVDEMALKEKPAFVEKAMGIINDQLGKHAYLAGDTLTLADLVLLAATEILEPTDNDPSGYTHFTAWRAELREKAFYQNTPTE